MIALRVQVQCTLPAKRGTAHLARSMRSGQRVRCSSSMTQQASKPAFDKWARFSPQSEYKRILAVDGGGLRAVIPSYILLQLEQLIKQEIVDRKIPDVNKKTYGSKDDFRIRLSDFFDICAGTSGGGLVSLFLSTQGNKDTEDFLTGDSDLMKAAETYPELKDRYPGSAAGLVATFLGKGSTIFYTNWFGITSGGLFSYNGYLQPKYNNDGLSWVAQKAIGENSTMAGDLLTSVIIPAWEIRGTRPYFFYHNDETKETGWATLDRSLTEHERPPGLLRGVVFQGNMNYRIWQVARATASAPTYFPAGEVGFNPGAKPGQEPTRFFIDGGVFCNNPTNFAMAFGARAFKSNMEKVAILSLGCGNVITQPESTPDAGAWTWLTKGDLINITLEGTSDSDAALADYFFHNLFPKDKDDQLMRFQYVCYKLDDEADAKGSSEGNEPLPGSNRLPSEVLGPMDNPAFLNDYITLAQRLLNEKPRPNSGHSQPRIDRLRDWVRDYIFADSPGPSSNGASNGSTPATRELAGATR